MLQAPHPSKESVPTRARTAAATIILLTGIAVGGIHPATSVAQDTEQPVIEENDPESIIKRKFDKRKWQDLSAAERDEFGELTAQMYKENPDDPKSQNLYADYLIASGQLAKAFPVLRELAEINPLRGLQAAAVARRLKLFEEANMIAEKSLSEMSKISAKEPANLSVSLAVSQNQLFLQRYTEAIQTLDNAIKLETKPEHQQLARQAYGDAIVAFVKHIEDSSDGTVTERTLQKLKLLQTAVKQVPSSPRIMKIVSDVLSMSEKDDNQEIAALRKELAEALENFRKENSESEKGIPDSESQ